MSLRLKNNLHYLKALCNCKPSARKAILKQADGELINCICECVDNILKGNIKISKAQKKKLGRHSTSLVQLRNRKTGLKKKRELLIQKGGFLPALLAPIISVAGGLLSNLLQ